MGIIWQTYSGPGTVRWANGLVAFGRALGWSQFYITCVYMQKFDGVCCVLVETMEILFILPSCYVLIVAKLHGQPWPDLGL